MPESIGAARERAPARIRIPRRAWRALLALLVVGVTTFGAVYGTAYAVLPQMLRSIFSSSAAHGIPPAFLERMLAGTPSVSYLHGATDWALIILTVLLAAALLLDARWIESVLPAWGGMALCYAGLLLLSTERPELPVVAAICAGWVAWVAFVAWAARRTEPREASAAPA